MSISVASELNRRLAIWERLTKSGSALRLSPALLRETSAYGGAQGVWVDKIRTGAVAPPNGVTIGLLHTGSSYADDLSDDCVLYHYPCTRRTGGRDESEVEATKNALRFGLPVFVITYPSPSSALRDVHFGWVEDWDDRTRVFLVSFKRERPAPRPEPELEFEPTPFQPINRKSRIRCEVPVRVGQQRFKFKVLKRYGPCCAVCSINIPELLDAAHIVPVEQGGTDDPRNGLVLCALHHRAFDAGLITIVPESTAVLVPKDGLNHSLLNVTRLSLEHFANQPHRDALALRWKLCVE